MAMDATLGRLKRSLLASTGTIVFGMEDGTVSIFGLVFGVAATTSSSIAILVAGASGAAAAAVSMMAGAYLDAETSRDQAAANQVNVQADQAAVAALLAARLAQSRLTARQCTALTAAVHANPDSLNELMVALQADPHDARSPLEQALWMLAADFFSAAVPMLPFFLLPVPAARTTSAIVTTLLLIALGIGRARIAGRGVFRTVIETVSIGIAAALAGVAIGLLVNRSVGG
jgi:VIT1/CCC1 family predicted Fe2+/Mn2+ transporter